MNEEYRHLRQAVETQIHAINERVKSLESLRLSLMAFKDQMDKVINKDDKDIGI